MVIARVFQGDILAPFLFIIVLDFVLQKTNSNRLQIHSAGLLPDLDFADYIMLLVQYKTEAIEYFQRIVSSAKKVGLNKFV